jgi:hypothetical protein
LDSDSISIWTCFLNLLLEFIRTGYPVNLYPIGLPNRLTRIPLEQLSRTPLERLTRSHQCLPGLICSYPVELPYLILLPIGLLLTRPYVVLPGRITLPDSSPDQTSTYSVLHDLTWPNYLTPSLLDQTSAYPGTLPDFLTWPGTTSLHPTTYPALPNHLTRSGTLQLASPKNFLMGLPP